MKKIVFVHCHPDDEIITTGMSIAKFIKAGHDVTVINFSGGESGNSYLSDYPAGTKLFKQKILLERINALEYLKVKKYMFIGPYHDSVPNKGPQYNNCLLNQDIDVLAKKLNKILIDINPDLIITYDRFGWSGHPDHIMVHKIIIRSLQLNNFKHYFPNVWFTVIPENINPISIAKNGEFDKFWISEYEKPDIEIDCLDVFNEKINALKKYETQINVQEDYWTLVGMDSFKIPHFTKEWFNIYKGNMSFVNDL
jgi:N-acetyl-1-D-myo-inositol-2-amino-2-deoxy-alpha-D-glucopyranoside deacetylase